MSDTTAKPQAVTCANMQEVRANIDRLDRVIMPLLAERAGYVAQAAGFKPTRAAVVDIPRIESMIASLRDQAQALGMDQDLAEDIYRNLIAAHIRFEEKQWDRLHQPA